MGPEHDLRIPVKFNGEELDLVHIETYNPNDDIPYWFDGYPQDLEVDRSGFVVWDSSVVGLLVHRLDKQPLFVSSDNVCDFVCESLHRRHPTTTQNVPASQPEGETK